MLRALARKDLAIPLFTELLKDLCDRQVTLHTAVAVAAGLSRETLDDDVIWKPAGPGIWPRQIGNQR